MIAIRLTLFMMYLIAVACIVLEWLVYFKVLTEEMATRVLFAATPLLLLVAVWLAVRRWTKP